MSFSGRPNRHTGITIPNHKTIAKGTLRAILRHASVTVQELIDAR